MPIYVFRCDACGHKFDHLQKMSAPDPDVCPTCGKHGTLRRQVTAPAFRLAGSGWYETDFKSDRETRHNLAGGGKPPESASGDGKRADKATDTGNAATSGATGSNKEHGKDSSQGKGDSSAAAAAG